MMEREIFKYIDGYRSSYKYHVDGNVNIVLSVPHGGSIMPDGIPDRTESDYVRLLNKNDGFVHEEHQKLTVVKDTRTDEFTENVVNELYKIWNFKPFVVIGIWNRRKIDFNRDIFEATLNHPEAVSAYKNYHMSLNEAINQVNNLFGKGLLIDVHGHSRGK